jgi:hypothetical protein
MCVCVQVHIYLRIKNASVSGQRDKKILHNETTFPRKYYNKITIYSLSINIK